MPITGKNACWRGPWIVLPTASSRLVMRPSSISYQMGQHLHCDYPTSGPYAEPSAEAVLKEINGYTWPERQQIASYQDLQDDGSTACGCWIYSGVYPSHDRNRARSRQPDGPDGPGTHSGVTWLSLSASAMPRASGLPRCNLFRATG
jgi:hypothetical protein